MNLNVNHKFTEIWRNTTKQENVLKWSVLEVAAPTFSKVLLSLDLKVLTGKLKTCRKQAIKSYMIVQDAGLILFFFQSLQNFLLPSAALAG